MHAGVIATTPGGTASVSVLIGGDPVPLYRRMDGRLFVAGIVGAPYVIRVRNLTHGRVKVVVSVDGRSVLDDKPADPYGDGLVIEPSRSSDPLSGAYDFRGWRVSDSSTGVFLFGDPAASIAALGGHPARIGAMGIAAWREEVPVRHMTKSYSGGGYGGPEVMKGGPTMDSAPVAVAAASAGPGLGTGMGEVVHDPVGRTVFRPAGSSPDGLVIGYDTIENLTAMGIVRPADPDPWPGAGQTGYARYAVGRD